MNTFSENPLFLFVDDLSDGSPNFAAEGKIVELSDTGCDARTSGTAFKVRKKSVTNIECSDSTKNNTINIALTSKTPKRNKPMTWNSTKVKAQEKNNRNEIKNGDNFVSKDFDDVKLSNCFKEHKVNSDQQKAKPNFNRTWLSAKYDESKQTGNLSAIQQSKALKLGSTIRSVGIEGKPKSSSSKFATNPRIVPSMKAAEVTSDASLNHGIKKFINRAVDKDSLSNCSRQLEVPKTFGNASKLPRISRTAKTLPKDKWNLGVSKLVETGNKIINSGVHETPDITVAGSQQKNRDKDIENEKTRRTNHNLSTEDRRDCAEGEPESKVIREVQCTGKSILEKQYDDDGKAELSTKNSYLNNFDPNKKPKRIAASIMTTQSSSKAKINISKVPLPRFNRNSIISNKVQSSGDPGDDSTELQLNNQKFKYNEKVSLKISNADTKNGSSTSFKTKLPKPKTPLVVPKLMNQFQLNNENKEIATCSPQNLKLRDSSLLLEANTEKLKAESSIKPSNSSAVLSNNFTERLSRFPSDAKNVTNSKKFKTKRNDDEIELKNGLEVASATLSKNPTPESSANFSKVIKSKESKPKPANFIRTPINPPSSPTIESKVPCPVPTIKRTPRKEITQKNFSAVRTLSKKQIQQGVTKNVNKIDTKKEIKARTPPVMKSNEPKAESIEVTETSALAEEDKDQDLIPIMKVGLNDAHSFVTRYQKRTNSENSTHQKPTCEGRAESWIDVHEQAYLKGRAIGLRVASMARAAKENLKCELIKSSSKTKAPTKQPNKSQEIVEIGVSLIEKVLAEKKNKDHAPSVLGDQPTNYLDFYKNTEWNNKKWFI